MKYVYMDHAATTPLDPEVLKTMQRMHVEDYGNPESLHLFGERANAHVERATELMLNILGAEKGKLVWTGGGSEANNLALKGIAKQYQSVGNHIIISSIEHDSVLETCHYLEKEEGFEVTYLPVDDQGALKAKDVEKALTDRTILVSVMHANNETGRIQPVPAIGKVIADFRRMNRSRLPFFHCDAVQTVGKLCLKTSKWGIDALTFSAHKFHGPKGVGGLYLHPRLRLTPLVHGGGQQDGLRSGTLNTPSVLGAAHALQLSEERMTEHTLRLQKWQHHIRQTLHNTPSIHLTLNDTCSILGQALPSHIHFRSEIVEGQAVMQELSRAGIAVSTSSACHARHWQPSHVMLAMGYSDAQAHQGVRITLGRTLTDDDVHYFLKTLQNLLYRFQTNHAWG